MREDEKLYEAIEEAARTKSRIRLEIEGEQDRIRFRMVSDTKLLVEDLFWMDEHRNVYRAIVEAGFENRKGLILPGFYVCGNSCLDGSGSGKTNMFRKENRFQSTR